MLIWGRYLQTFTNMTS